MDSSGLSHQNWNNVVFHKPPTYSQQLRRGNTISVEKTTKTNFKKLDENDLEPPKKTGLELGKKIQQARVNKKLTQKQLATSLNEKPQIIQQYENGSAIPNPQILNKLKKLLSTTLK